MSKTTCNTRAKDKFLLSAQKQNVPKSSVVSAVYVHLSIFPTGVKVQKLKLSNRRETSIHYRRLSSVVTLEEKQISNTEAQHRHLVVVVINTLVN